MITYIEEIVSDFEGTIIDLETIGDFSNYPDSRQYKNIIPVIFGYMDNNGINIICAKNKDSISLLKQKVKEILPTLKKPFHAFQSNFESGALSHFLGKVVDFERELNAERFEKKEKVVKTLNISTYDDPFNGNGFMCMRSWLNGDINKAIAHNRSCLLKERDILRIRGSRKPDSMVFRI